jgi:hypothetical protein
MPLLSFSFWAFTSELTMAQLGEDSPQKIGN